MYPFHRDTYLGRARLQRNGVHSLDLAVWGGMTARVVRSSPHPRGVEWLAVWGGMTVVDRSSPHPRGVECLAVWGGMTVVDRSSPHPRGVECLAVWGGMTVVDRSSPHPRGVECSTSPSRHAYPSTISLTI